MYCANSLKARASSSQASLSPVSLSACHSVGVEFIPVVAETLGGLSQDTISTIGSLGQAIGWRVGSADPSTPLNTSSVVLPWPCGEAMLASGNASLWLHRHPTLPPFLDGSV